MHAGIGLSKAVWYVCRETGAREKKREGSIESWFRLVAETELLLLL